MEGLEFCSYNLVLWGTCAPRTWVNGHNDNHIDEIEDVLNGVGGSGNVERDAHLTPEIFHLRQRLE